MHAKIVTDTNARAILAVLKTTREAAMVLLSLKAGLRAVEIAGLTWGAIREDDTIIELVSTKGGEPRTVPVNKELRKVLQAYRAECKRTGDDDHVFLARHAKPGTPLTANAVAASTRVGSAGRGTPRTRVAVRSPRRPRGKRRSLEARCATCRTCWATPA